MQSKRRQILDILKENGAATVEELRRELGITSVTVRHHLDVLRSESLVSEPTARHRNSPGRPQYEYSLTPEAESYFPKSYANFSSQVLSEIKTRFDDETIDEIFASVGHRITEDAPAPAPDQPLENRLEQAVDYLNEKGYVAGYQQQAEGWVLHTNNCPYEGLPNQHPEICCMDEDLMNSLMGLPVERICHLASGGENCAYLIRTEEVIEVT